MLNKPRNPGNITQAVISVDQNFILAKNINNFTDVISPFKKSKDHFSSNFILPINQLHRISTLYEALSSISQYTVVDNTIRFDCVSNLPTDMFGDATEGYIHFSAVKQTKKDKDKVEIDVDPKVVFQNVEEKMYTFTRNHKIKFKSDFLKAFPIILRPGMMFSTVNKTVSQLFISVLNPSEGYVGECSKYEIVNVIQYLLPLWPIFDINISSSIQIKFQDEFIQDFYKDEHDPILLYINYSLDKPEEISMTKFGQNVSINNSQ